MTIAVGVVVGGGGGSMLRDCVAIVCASRRLYVGLSSDAPMCARDLRTVGESGGIGRAGCMVNLLPPPLLSLGSLTILPPQRSCIIRFTDAVRSVCVVVNRGDAINEG